MNGLHSVTGPGPCLHNNSVFAPRRYHENIGLGRWDAGRCCTLEGQLPGSDISQVCMLPANNHPLLLCLQTKYNYGNFKLSPDRLLDTNSLEWQTQDSQQPTLSTARKGKLNICPPSLTLQCSVYHKRVLGRGRRGWENMFLFTSSQAGEQQTPQEAKS